MPADSQSLAEIKVRQGFLKSLAQRHPVFLFFVLTYVLGWGMVTPRVLSWLGLLSFRVPDWWVTASFYAPCVAGVWMQWLSERNLRVCRLYESAARLLLGFAVGIFLVLIGNTVVPALLAEKAPLSTLHWHVLFSLASYRFHYSAFITPIGEEIGWRGYALPRLQMRFGPVWASLLIGLMWAGFMLPALTMVQMWMSRAVFMYAIGLVALSVEITFAMNLSRLSIIVPVIMHTLASAVTGYLSVSLIAHSESRSNWEWVWSLSNLIVPTLIIFATRGRLAATSPKLEGYTQSVPSTQL